MKRWYLVRMPNGEQHCLDIVMPFDEAYLKQCFRNDSMPVIAVYRPKRTEAAEHDLQCEDN